MALAINLLDGRSLSSKHIVTACQRQKCDDVLAIHVMVGVISALVYNSKM